MDTLECSCLFAFLSWRAYFYVQAVSRLRNANEYLLINEHLKTLDISKSLHSYETHMAAQD